MTSLLARTVHLIVSAATLLSGDLEDCLFPLDSSCEAGVASLNALARNLTGNDPYLVIPKFDKSSPFVQMHPLGWSVNRLVLEEVMGWKTFQSTPALLTSHYEDFDVSSRDLSDLQSSEFPFLLSNVAVPPGNSWSPYVTPVYLDPETGLAIISIVNDNQPMNVDQVDTTFGMLNYVERLNQRGGCYAASTSSASQQSLLDTYVNRTIAERQCWIPVILYADTRSNFEAWLTPVINHKNPPALIVNTEEPIDDYMQPIRLPNSKGGLWIVTYEVEDDVYTQLELTIADGGRAIASIEKIERDMEVIPDNLKDQVYLDQQSILRSLADEAATNDPVVGQSMAVPPQRDGTYRRCKAGECEVGNLFNDAARWYTQSDVGFQASGGYRGPGWDEGGVKVSNIWSSLPFDNTLCTGVISGVSLFQLFNYSVTYSTFEGENTQLGDRLLQVSGLRISYNLQLPEDSRLVQMEVWNEDRQEYANVDRLGLYSFVTDSYTCSGFVEYPILLGDESLTQTGEVPGKIGSDIIIQTVVGDYLAQFEQTPYDPNRQGNRLVNRTDLLTPLNLVQTPDSCLPGEYWQEEIASCSECPDETSVSFLSAKLEFDGDAGSDRTIRLVNTALFDIAVLVKSMPSWVSITSASYEDSGVEVGSFSGNSTSVDVTSGQTLMLTFRVNLDMLEPGTGQGTVAFGVVDGGNYPGCTGRDASFEIFARKYPPEDLNQLGSIRYVGFVLAAIACLMALGFTGWVIAYRKMQVVRVLQPEFLCAISGGVFVMASVMIPLSIDDEIVSQESSDIACASTPWLLSLGFIVAMSALFSKLWRIQRLFKATEMGRRVNVGVKNVLGPFAVMFVLNCTVLLTWSIVSPLRFQRESVEGEPWNSYGICQSDDKTFGTAMTAVVFIVNAIPLFGASYMAYRVRNVSSEFSESKRVALALFTWVQLVLVVGPMLALIESDNPAARYFLQIGAIFLVCVSMLCLIFVPIVWQKKKAHREAQRKSNTASVRQNGIESVSTYSKADQRNSAESNSFRKFSLRDNHRTHVSGVDFTGSVYSTAEDLGKLDEVAEAEVDDDGQSSHDDHTPSDFGR
ncbi:unnamed protein product [Cylindrotheca closterium]|uniref:G-protein coupled receptors family 3 profile domain-containing protein n=1 Tax=Cylindrotheca closterium TaxID=2856 RepID=A0AAD2FYL5_9STRA|nr:unnamed protein product [Cylindrotheca closterium]